PNALGSPTRCRVRRSASSHVMNLNRLAPRPRCDIQHTEGRTMLKNIDMDKLKHQLAEDGYAVVENVLDSSQLERIREVVARRMEYELANPLPLDDEKHDDDDDIRA